MRKIDTTQIVDPTSQQPFTGKSLKFIQDASIEAIGASVIGLIGANYSATTVYVLSGCTIASSVISNGYVFYGGEVYTFIGADTSAYADTAVVKFQQPYDTSIDPVMFSDGVNKYIHELPQFYIADDVSGSTAYGDYADVVFVNNNKKDLTVLTPAASSVPTGFLKLVGSDFTGPNHIYNVKVRVEGDVRVPFVTDGKILWETNVTNETTVANYATDGTIGDNTAIIATQTRSFRYVATRYLTNLPAGTALSIRQRNQQTDAHVFENIVLTYEVY